MLRDKKMPPQDAAQPTLAQRQSVLTWIKEVLNSAPAAPDTADPGHVVMRRLNRYEYTNTVRDLFYLGAKTWRYFPAPGSEFPAESFMNNKRTYSQPWNLPPDARCLRT
jgi:hypothetical protein